MATYIVTGSAGFIGSHVALILLERGDEVVGIDNLNSYYDTTLKAARLARLEGRPGFRFEKADLADKATIARIFEETRPDGVVNLAAQAGVRYSLEQPSAYVDSNVVGFLSILEGCRATQPRHLVFASTSSVYGANTRLPFSVEQAAVHPLTLYAATKMANEMMAHSYAHLFKIPCTGLRFFTVYGPWGRPDMAPIKFAKAIVDGQPIDVYGEGKMQRDFTFIDDIARGVVQALDQPATIDLNWDGQNPNPSTSGVAPYRILNIGNSQRVELMHFIRTLEHCLGREARLNMMPMQQGDAQSTEADIAPTMATLGYEPTTSVEVGVQKFVDWYLHYRGLNR
ncbi:MAG: NAD-dependent epimerase [Asticcacaulis sp.]